MKFGELAKYFERLEKTASRLEMTEVLAELYKEVSSEEIPVVVYMSLGQLRPKFDRLEFNLAEKMALRAVAEAVEKSVDEVKKEYKQIGDVGDLVQGVTSHESRVMSKLSVLEVYEKLVKVAGDEGQGSQERKVTGVAKLLAELDGLSGKFVARLVVGKLRLGFSDMTILDALSWMVSGDKSKRKRLENAYQLYPDTGKLAQMVKEHGVDKLEEVVEVELGVPVIPALAQRLKTADEMIEKMGKVAVEPKYDGTRVQIHFARNGFEETRIKNQESRFSDSLFEMSQKKMVRTFTRNLDETTHMFPEIQELGKYFEADELILDSEAVGFDPETGEMLPFQETIKRKRKHGVKQAAKEIPLTFFVFDVLYKDGKSLVKEVYHDRRKLLESMVESECIMNPEETYEGKTGLVVVPEVLVTENPENLRQFHGRQLEMGLEGALVKKWDGIYEPGRRGWSWVKFKETEDSKAKLSDTVDAVVMGTYVGRGKRAGFGVGAFLIGIRGEKDTKNKKQETKKSKSSNLNKQSFEEGMFYTITKVGTGLTDEQWVELRDRSKEFEVESKPKEYEVDKNLEPDQWLAPGLVVEIAADEVTISPIHTAGLALRFPRLVRFRDDKSAEQVTSVDELKKI